LSGNFIGKKGRMKKEEEKKERTHPSDFVFLSLFALEFWS
jgi:hypothetical protein